MPPHFSATKPRESESVRERRRERMFSETHINMMINGGNLMSFTFLLYGISEITAEVK
jgi:hypothetical protein